MVHCLITQIFHLIAIDLSKGALRTIEILSIIINLTSGSLFLNAARCWSFNGYNLLPTLIPKPEWIVVPLIFIAASPVEAKSKILGLSASPRFYPKTLFKDKENAFIKWDFSTSALPVINM